MRPVTSAEDFYILLQAKGGGSGPEPSTRPELRAALVDLVRTYAAQRVQDGIASAHMQHQEAQRQGARSDWVHCLRRLLEPLQLSVAEKHGFSGSLGGLQKMQNAIIRRICEGDAEFRDLSNQCLQLLALPPVQKLTFEVTAEELLYTTVGADKGDPSASRTTLQSLIDAVELAERRDVGPQRQALQLLQVVRRPVPELDLGTLATWTAWERCGLPTDFACRPEAGSARLERVPRLWQPTAEQVFQYVMLNQPVVIAGMLDEGNFPPLEDFKDFEYLKSRCGHRHVKLKGDPSLDALGRKVFINDPFVSVQLADYLDMLETSEQEGNSPPYYMGKVLLAEEAPEMLEDIEAALRSPWRLYGSAFGRNKGGVHTYFGCGQNTTSLHADPSENLLTVVFGRKTLQLFPPCDADCLYTSVRKPLNSCVPPFLLPGDMDPQLKVRFPKYQHTSPVTVELVAGDILYLPIFWWHSVSGGRERNMVVNWWSEMHPSKVTAHPEPASGMNLRDFIASLSLGAGA